MIEGLLPYHLPAAKSTPTVMLGGVLQVRCWLMMEVARRRVVVDGENFLDHWHRGNGQDGGNLRVAPGSISQLTTAIAGID